MKDGITSMMSKWLVTTKTLLCSAKIVYFLTTPNGVHSQNRKTGV